MPLIDFDAEFERVMRRWMKENQERFKGNLDRMEEEVPEVYLQFLETPAAFLDGQSPRAYFEHYTDPAELLSLLGLYLREHVPVPDLLLERITELPGAEAALTAFLWDGETPEEGRMMAISLLEELESTAPLADYVRYIARAPGKDDAAEHMAEALCHMGQGVVEPILEAYAEAPEAAQDLFCDVLSNFRGDSRIAQLLRERFAKGQNLALYASYLAKYGDESALPDLMAACEDPGLSYLDFVEISNAIEALGGEAPSGREYAGDPYYEALSRME